jgi:hypothetical protein
MHLNYHVWRVGRMDPILLGDVGGRDYMDARRRAEGRFGKQIEIYLPPAKNAMTANQPEKQCDSPRSMIASMSSRLDAAALDGGGFRRARHC